MLDTSVISPQARKSNMDFKVEAKKPKHRKWIEALLPSLVKQLKLEKFDKSVFVVVEDTGPANPSGLTMPMAEFGYVVALRPDTLYQLAVSLCHEMTHVKQMARGQLKQLENGSMMWCGKKYSKNTPYLDAPWELEAFSKQEILVRRAIEL